MLVFVFREDRIELGGMSGDGSDVKRDAASTSDATPNGMVRQSSTVDDTSVGRGVQYSVEESPPWHMSVLLGFQVRKMTTLPNIVTAGKRSCGKVMYLHVFVCPQGRDASRG